MKFLTMPFLFLSLSVGILSAQEPSATEPPNQTETAPADEEAQWLAAVTAMLEKLDFKTGDQRLMEGAFTLSLPQGYQFLSEQDATTVLVDLWGNPAEVAEDTLGLIVPEGENLIDEDSWAVVVSFEDTGYIDDADAASTDYNELLEVMQDQTKASNEFRAAQGIGPVDLVGWAIPPRYESDTQVLHWAKELAFDRSSDHTLNYDVRVLGRRGVVSLNCVAPMSKLESVRAATPDLVSLTAFGDGHRYSDFDASTDKKSEMGMAGLIVGGAVAAKVAAKVGILKGLFLGLLAMKKFLIIGLIALVVGVKKFFGAREAA